MHGFAAWIVAITGFLPSATEPPGKQGVGPAPAPARAPAPDQGLVLKEPEQLERFLHNWIFQYVTSDAEASPETKARLPLREAKVQVRPNPGKPGSFQCILHLSPHYELDDVKATVKLATELMPARS